MEVNMDGVSVNKIPKEKFKIEGCGAQDSEKITRQQVTYWKDAWRRLKKNKVAMASIVMLTLIAGMTVIGPYLNGFSFSKIDNTSLNKWPDAVHWFGTDVLGRDIFSRVWIGGRVSMIIGVLGALISTVVGCVYGGIAAYAGGKTDMLMMRVVEVLSSVPHLLVVILLSVALDAKGLGTMLLAMTITGWCGLARMVRGQILQIRRSEYVVAAEALGISPMKIIMRHLIPNTLSVIIVSITFSIPGYIFSETFLSYIGLGVQSPNTSWGAMASAAQVNLLFYPYQMFFPAILLALTMLSFTLLGDGLRDALDPRYRQ